MFSRSAPLEFGKIDINHYDYELPKERIASYPLAERDRSKLLVYKEGDIHEDVFCHLGNHLPEKPLIFVNNTRVIHARLHFIKRTGALIEIFCLEPVAPHQEVQLALQNKERVTWKCLVRNSRKWKDETLQITVPRQGITLTLSASRKKIEGDHSVVDFDWYPVELSFSDILEILGKTPLPPYIEREAEDSDNQTYQTVYARHDGSVAAPTAGLHFTDKVLNGLKELGGTFADVTLHVGAGTFKPVDAQDIRQHTMHEEEVHVPKSTIEKLLTGNNRRIVVGTTSTRTLESIYWQGVKWLHSEPGKLLLDIRQWDPYVPLFRSDIPLERSVEKVLTTMDKFGSEVLSGHTGLIIIPGYRFRVPDGLITNFHLPRSTLLLLIAAYIGDDWKRAYRFALDNGFRFLSYGDSCLFFKNKAGQ
jgi:S-adenosylmethionine:tRNA ribosyltransferase-isomerase